MGAFFLKFSIGLAAKLLIKKVSGMQKGTDLLCQLCHNAKYGGDRELFAGCRRKSVIFFVCLFLSRFGMTKFVITEMLWSRVIFKTIMASLRRGRFVVVHLYLTVSVDPHNFPLGVNLYQKLLFFSIFGAVSPYF